MGLNKQYKGYKAYQYLEAGKDYRAFELCDGDKVFPEYLIELTEEEEKRVLKLAEEKIFISIHEHPVLFPKHLERDVFEFNREGRQPCAYEELSRSYLDCVFDNLMDGTCTIYSKNGWKWVRLIQLWRWQKV